MTPAMEVSQVSRTATNAVDLHFSFMSNIAYGAALNSNTSNAHFAKKLLVKMSRTTAAFVGTTHTFWTRQCETTKFAQ